MAVEAFAVDGVGEVNGVDLRTNGTAFAANGGRLTARDTRISAPVLSFTNPQGAVRVARSGVTNTTFAGDHAPVCVFSWEEADLEPLAADCTLP